MNPAKVTIDLYNMMGQKVARAYEATLGSGKQEATIGRRTLGLSAGNYAFQFTTENSFGKFFQTKMLTIE